MCGQELNCIKLDWTAAVDDGIGVMGYFIFRDGAPIDTVDGTQRSYEDCFTDDTPTTVFNYQIQPFDSLQNVQRLGGERACEFWGVPHITMAPEPNVTKGNSNTVCWSPSADIFVSYTVFIAPNCDDTSADSLRLNDAKETCATFSGLADGVEYCYRVKGLDEHGRTVVSDQIHSTQDASAPESMAGALRDCYNTGFVVPFAVWDELSASVDSVRLYYRHDPTGDWLSAPDLVKDVAEDMVAASAELALADSIAFTAVQDGYVEFYVAGKDTARTPAAHPGDPLTSEDGNWDTPLQSEAAQTFTYIDTQDPWSEIALLDSVQKSLCFQVPYHADDILKDGFESGLSKVTLCYRFEDEDEVVRCDSVQIFNGAEATINSFFVFTASKGDGRYSFFTEATDACGNVQTAIPDPKVTDVRGTPQIIMISPEPSSFNFADSVAAIEFYFDRQVNPVREYEDAFQIVNRYMQDRVLNCEFDTMTVSEDLFKVVCTPDSIEASGFFEIWVDKSQIAFSTECDTLPAITEHFAFYTYMEAGQGGEIVTEEVTLSVPSGEPTEDVVIIFEPTEPLCTPTGFERPSDQCVTITAFGDRLNGEIFSGIPGRLCLHYDTPLPDGMDPATVRVFEQIGGRCRPAGDSRTWAVDLSAQFACTDLEEVIGAFCLFGQSPGLLAQQKTLSNYPNPMSTDGTTITYLLDTAGADVRIRIFDLFGNMVKTFTNVTSNEGLNTCPWDGQNDMGEKAANGGYICVMVVNGKEKYRRKIGVMW
jgi:hypothetical protein